MTSAFRRARAAGRNRRVALTRRGWSFLAVAVVALLAGYIGPSEVFLFVGFLLLALPLISFAIIWLRRPRLDVSRVFSPGIISAGGTTRVTVTVRNTSPRDAAPAQSRDIIPWHPYATQLTELPGLRSSSQYFGARDRTAITYDLTPLYRGVFEVGPFLVLGTDPFRLVSSSVLVGEQQPFIVTPEVVPLSSAALSNPVGDGEATLVQRRSAGDDDDTITREYRSGDAMRRVHWRASARHGDLMVRQEETRSLPAARIIVDTQRMGYRDVSTDWSDYGMESASFEWVVEMLASSAVHLRRTGFQVSIEEAGVVQLDELSQGRQRTWGDDEFLTRLATLELADEPAERPGRSGTSKGPVIALFSTPTKATVDWMLAQRRPGELAVAFAVHELSSLDRIDRSLGVTPDASRIAHRFADAGWLVVPVRPDDDPAAAWEAIVIESGRSHVAT